MAKIDIHEFVRMTRQDAYADECSDDAMKASETAHKTGESVDHHRAAFAHAQAADHQRKRQNFSMAAHHDNMSRMHGEEAAPDSEEHELMGEDGEK